MMKCLQIQRNLKALKHYTEAVFDLYASQIYYYYYYY